MCVLQLFVNQVLTSLILKLTLSFYQALLYFYMTKKARQKIKYLENMKEKAFFIIFKGLSIAKNCLRRESAPLRIFFIQN